jgi:hypothetical protein
VHYISVTPKSVWLDATIERIRTTNPIWSLSGALSMMVLKEVDLWRQTTVRSHRHPKAAVC